MKLYPSKHEKSFNICFLLFLRTCEVKVQQLKGKQKLAF